MSGTRTFIAVSVSDAIRSRAADLVARLQVSQAPVSWVSPQNMHITLKFLGDQTDDQLVAVCRAVKRGAQTVSAFDFGCRGAGAFPDPQRPRTLWIGVSEGHDDFVRLHAAIQDELAGLGVSRDRRGFQPHLTLGRVRGGGPAVRELTALIQENDQFAAAEGTAAEVQVISSRLDRRGAMYDVLARAPLVLPVQ